MENKNEELPEHVRRKLMMFHLISFCSDHGYEINICDNRKNHGTIWIAWANALLDKDDFIHKGDYKGSFEEAVIKACDEMISKMTRRKIKEAM